MKFKKTWTGNIENAFRGLRHPYESYDKSDSGYLCSMSWEKGKLHDDNCGHPTCHGQGKFVLGPNDIDLAQRMIKAGTPNDKFLRQIFVSVDITAPLYFWKELDTYKVGTVANSTSTMHKLATTPITIDCFEMDDFNNGLIIEDDNNPTFIVTINDRAGVFIDALEKLRKKYLKTKDKRYWKELIRWLPESWLQTRTFTCNYAVLRNIIHWRKNHRLKYEWDSFIAWAKTLPYANELLFYNNGYDDEYKLHDLLSQKQNK